MKCHSISDVLFFISAEGAPDRTQHFSNRAFFCGNVDPLPSSVDKSLTTLAQMKIDIQQMPTILILIFFQKRRQ